jgi:hypothetical protein
MQAGGVELTTITAQFQGQTVNAAQANPYSLQAVQEAMIDLQLNPQDCLLILRRSVNNELTAEVDPSPKAYMILIKYVKVFFYIY